MPTRVSLLEALLLSSTVLSTQVAAAATHCRIETFEGSASARAAYVASIGGGPERTAHLNLNLEPVASGWRLRIVPTSSVIPSPDYAEIATPPYQSPNPLLLTTDYRFRAQDVIAWNPRRFQYAADAASYRRLAALYADFERTSAAQALHTPSGVAAQANAAARLASQAAQAMAGELDLLDARLVPGTINQSAAAAAVATHLGQTAHTTEQAAAQAADPAGQVTWIRFRIRLILPPGFNETGAAGKLASGPCL